jgi:hypothetical protein
MKEPPTATLILDIFWRCQAMLLWLVSRPAAILIACYARLCGDRTHS